MERQYTLIRQGEIKQGIHAGGVLYTVIYTDYRMGVFYFIDKQGLDNRNLVQKKMKEFRFERYYTFDFDFYLDNDIDRFFTFVEPKELTDFLTSEFEKDCEHKLEDFEIVLQTLLKEFRDYKYKLERENK